MIVIWSLTVLGIVSCLIGRHGYLTKNYPMVGVAIIMVANVYWILISNLVNP